MDEPQKHYEWKNIKWKQPVINYHTVYGPIYMKCLEQANVQRQKAEQWLPTAGGRTGDEEWLLMGTRLPFGMVKMF